MGKMIGSSLNKGNNKGHDDGEAWLISYADMVTLLMAFFVILFVLGSVDKPENLKELSKVIAMSTGRDSIRMSSGDAFELQEIKAQLEKVKLLTASLGLGNDIETIVKEVNERILLESKVDQLEAVEKWKVEGKQVAALVENELLREKSINLNLPSKILYASGSNNLSADGKKLLGEVFQEISSLNRQFKLKIVGHTDSRSASKSRFGSNWGLSAARASGVANFFETLGVKPETIQVIGKGRSELLVKDHTDKGLPIPEKLSQNRRVELTIVFDPAEGSLPQ